MDKEEMRAARLRALGEAPDAKPAAKAETVSATKDDGETAAKQAGGAAAEAARSDERRALRGG